MSERALLQQKGTHVSMRGKEQESTWTVAASISPVVTEQPWMTAYLWHRRFYHQIYLVPAEETTGEGTAESPLSGDTGL
jgi:hypothetical protein